MSSKSYGVFDSIERGKTGKRLPLKGTGEAAQSLILRLSQFVIIVILVAVVYTNKWLYHDGRLSTTTKLTDTTKSKVPKLSDNAKPNFVLILADDLSFQSLNTPIDTTMEYLTKELSFLANNGIYMNNFYAQEVCTPSRAALLTGMYPIHIGVQHGLDNGETLWGLNASFPLISEALDSSGYTSYAFGKWHLGFTDSKWLPTSRGFSEYVGYLMGQNYYWSKIYPTSRSTYSEDFLSSNVDCFYPYSDADKTNYSTFLYTSMAVRVIEKHATEDETSPFFLYLPFQNVHSPYYDVLTYANATVDDYIPADTLALIEGESTGDKRREYLKSLYLLDDAVRVIRNKLVDVGLMDNTYIIFMSDNGGCVSEGGFINGYRGTKGSLFDGGVKVDSFIYSPLLKNKGLVYNNLMHSTDWFPTMLDLARIEQTGVLDGVSHAPNWMDLQAAPPRTKLVHNINTNVYGKVNDIWTNASLAVRNEKYKLLHEYQNAVFDGWYAANYTNTDDALEYSTECNQDSAYASGSVFKLWLFDMINDPYETTNLYYSELAEHVAAKEELYEFLYESMANAAVDYVISGYPSYTDVNKSSIYDGYILPYEISDGLTRASYCEVQLTF